jgi:hypothetical protein
MLTLRFQPVEALLELGLGPHRDTGNTKMDRKLLILLRPLFL